MERREHRTAVVVIGADVEEHHEGEKRKCEISEVTIALRQRQAAAGPAEPASVGERRDAAEQHVVDRIGASASEKQCGAHGEIAGRHRPFVDAGGALPAEHRHEQHGEAHRHERRETGQESRHQHEAHDEFGRAEQDDAGIEQPEVGQHVADDVVRAEQCARHGRLEFVRHPIVTAPRVELARP